MKKENKSSIIKMHNTKVGKGRKKFSNKKFSGDRSKIKFISKIVQKNFKNKHKEDFYLYPNYAKKEYENVGLKIIKDSNTLLILEKADSAANKMDYDSALKLYHYLLSNQELSSFKKNNDGVQRQFKTLKVKMEILLKCKELQACLDKKDFLNLPYILNNIGELYNSFIYKISKTDLKFFEQIKELHQHYSQSLIKKKR